MAKAAGKTLLRAPRPEDLGSKLFPASTAAWGPADFDGDLEENARIIEAVKEILEG